MVVREYVRRRHKERMEAPDSPIYYEILGSHNRANKKQKELSKGIAMKARMVGAPSTLSNLFAMAQSKKLKQWLNGRTKWIEGKQRNETRNPNAPLRSSWQKQTSTPRQKSKKSLTSRKRKLVTITSLLKIGRKIWSCLGTTAPRSDLASLIFVCGKIQWCLKAQLWSWRAHGLSLIRWNHSWGIGFMRSIDVEQKQYGTKSENVPHIELVIIGKAVARYCFVQPFHHVTQKFHHRRALFYIRSPCEHDMLNYRPL